MIQVLFVDHDPEVLEGLRRVLRGWRDRWSMSFVSDVRDALDALAASPFDVVVSDILMPGLDHPTFLADVRDQHPGAVRIVFSGTDATKTLPVAHQFLSKPCDPIRLEAAIDRALLLRDRMTSPELRDLVTGLDTLPSPSATIVALQSALSVRPVDPDRVAYLVHSDIAISTKVLQVANSAFFGLPRTLTDPVEAIHYLGALSLGELVMSSEVFRSFRGRARSFDGEIERLQLEGMIRADLACKLAQRAGRSANAAREMWVPAFLADIGLLLLLADRAEQGLAVKDWTDLDESALALVPTIGAYLASTWGLPHKLVEGIALNEDRPARHGSDAASFTWIARHLMPGGPPLSTVAAADLEVVGLRPTDFDSWRPATPVAA